MTKTSTSFVGPLGSTIYRLRADAATVAALAPRTPPRPFPPPRNPGPKSVHFSNPICVHFSRPIDTYLEALAESRKTADAFLAENGPDLVVEVEITHADEGKIARYADLGVREFWRLRGEHDGETLSANFLALRRGERPRPLEASVVLPGLTPSDVCEAVDDVQLSPDHLERVEAVARIVRRREQQGFRVREERAPYGAAPPDGDLAAAAVEAIPLEGLSTEDPW